MNSLDALFKELHSCIASEDFVKFTVSKPLRKKEGLLNVYMRNFLQEDNELFEFKYRYNDKEIYKNVPLNEAIKELEHLLMTTFRAGTLFTLQKDVIVMISKNKAVSFRENLPSFKNKLPEFSRKD